VTSKERDMEGVKAELLARGILQQELHVWKDLKKVLQDHKRASHFFQGTSTRLIPIRRQGTSSSGVKEEFLHG
jgi:hypothetical protein